MSDPITIIQELGGVLSLVERIGDLFDKHSERGNFEQDVKHLLCGVPPYDEMVEIVRDEVNAER